MTFGVEKFEEPFLSQFKTVGERARWGINVTRDTLFIFESVTRRFHVHARLLYAV